MNTYSEKTIKDMEWKKADTYEWKCRVLDIRFSIIRLRTGVWELRMWDETEGWKFLARHERGYWSSSKWEHIFGPPWGFRLIATQKVWNIVKSQPHLYQKV
jgi:hypothetical protein